MNRNQYDGDITIYSPQGRLYQIEYAMEAVKQGAACVGVRSDTDVVLATCMRTPSKLAEYQRKLFRIDDHIGISIAGLTADARVLCKYMRRETLNHRFVYEAPLQTARLVRRVADKSQIHTQQMGRRPYGVGMLVAGYDRTGPHLFETCPSGNMFEFHAQAIGARCQSAKTYLERTYKEYPSLPLEELVRHAVRALRETTGRKTEPLNDENLSIAVVGKDHTFRVLTKEETSAYLASIDDDAAPSTSSSVADDTAAPMEE
mmetsp:Transcript_23494/g.58815  ORF Transcript_23494/g.58815 Transcript_23494/m.58815 type:complete len:260 (+) Transcript_23494:116-895(+)|eukprot:CAMPEP_0177651034 /NCGR_PEP_ID=MMETSP0447-20121125/12297_1 /TAXON_ID=0 /ORGANISM="Stygamoeba regulata, Strain BSH-02190019" /LENGTH=259 /DNA_ID=CAMNT_0019154017 /DNA_START=108 /DNA_END=887 /DNA_ORIENTATION=-